ncbi:MAG: 3'-5' exoribonuclease YhaM family protein, partial [Thermodesulfobacteriota bacterium]
KKDGNPFLRLVLSDRTGTIDAVLWDNVEPADAAVTEGMFVRATGSVSTYKGTPQLTLTGIDPVETSQVNPADFLPVTTGDVNAMFRRLLALTRAMTSPDLRRLLERFWADDDFVENRFKRAPGAKMMHHAYLGGLLEHTVAVAELALVVADRYPGRLDRDMLLAGAILHDIGKTREFVYDTVIDYSDEGRLLNHMVLGIMMVEEKLAQVEDFSPERANLVKHMVASHHGTREFGAVEPPKTLEALVLNHIDEVDSKVAGIGAFMDSHDPRQKWTSYHRSMERYFYMGNGKDTESV